MRQKRRSTGFMLALLCTFTLLLAACQTGPSAQRQARTQHTSRLTLRESPTSSAAATSGAGGAATTYVGQTSAEDAWLGLSTAGQRMVAFVTDGSQNHEPTFAQWFRGSVNNGVVDVSTPAKTGTDRLQAKLTSSTATGTVTLANGKSIPFTANAIPEGDQSAGLYRGEHKINGQRYVAGWIVLPAAGAQGTATESPSASATSSATATETPSTTPSATATETPSTTPSATATGPLQQGGALLNEQTFAVLPLPPLTQEQINAKQVTVPNQATFQLVPCQKNLC